MTSETEEKTCRKCKHLLGRRDYPMDWENWNCGHVNNYSGTRIHPVSGEGIRIFVDINILRVRIEKCHKENWYEEYIKPEPLPTIGGAEATELVFDTEALANAASGAAKRLEEIKNKKLNLGAIKANEL